MCLNWTSDTFATGAHAVVSLCYVPALDRHLDNPVTVGHPCKELTVGVAPREQEVNYKIYKSVQELSCKVLAFIPN